MYKDMYKDNSSIFQTKWPRKAVNSGKKSRGIPYTDENGIRYTVYRIPFSSIIF